MFHEEISLQRAALLMHLSMVAPNTVQGYLRQLAESVVNRRINSEDEVNGNMFFIIGRDLFILGVQF